MDDREARERVATLESLLEGLEGPGEAAVATLLELYGEALGRVVARIPAEGRLELAEDELVSHLLMLHGLHPVPLAARVEQALDEVRPYLKSHGGGVELDRIDDGVVRLALRGSCSGCPSSRVTLEHAVEEAIQRRAPDALGVEARDAEAERPLAAPQFTGCELPVLDGGPAR